MSPSTIYNDISKATQNLLKIARDASYNSISDNLSYIVRKELVSAQQNFRIQKELRKKINDAKPRLNLDQAVEEILQDFDNIYEIDSYVYKSEERQTVIEIEIIKKDPHFHAGIENTPFLHCKVAIAPYASAIPPEQNRKFDINWEHGSFEHKWKMFWWRLKAKWS